MKERKKRRKEGKKEGRKENTFYLVIQYKNIYK
jgi:hypothetical protein